MTSVFRTPELSACKNHSRLHRFFIRLQTKHKVTHVDSGLISDSGKYLTSLRQRQMKTVCFVLLFVSLVFGDTGEEKSVMEGENITLPSDVKQPNETVLWYFEDTRIALINGEPSTSCLYYGKGEIFRDRLDVDYKTGSLIITDIRSEHAGRYETEIIRGNSTGKSVPLNRKSNCDSTNINNKSSNNSNTIKTFNVHVNATKPRVSKSVHGGPVSCSVLLQLAPTHLPGSI
uniref:Immunoglobulin V-set domain-containing protein n=1 Tax=Cyprinus carpio carpio TaxID=630221 RepID=A0A9J7X7F1_CYPCA